MSQQNATTIEEHLNSEDVSRRFQYSKNRTIPIHVSINLHPPLTRDGELRTKTEQPAVVSDWPSR